MAELHPRVLRQLETSAVAYRILRHEDFSSTIRSPRDFAFALGWPVDRIAKTLLLRTREKNPPVFCAATLPVPKRIDFKALELLIEIGRLQIATEAELAEVVGYPSMGVSPLGLNTIQITIDSALMENATIAVGGGAVGVEVEIEPEILAKICRARVAVIS